MICQKFKNNKFRSKFRSKFEEYNERMKKQLLIDDDICERDYFFNFFPHLR